MTNKEREQQALHKLNNGTCIPVCSLEEAECLRDLELKIHDVELQYEQYAEKHLDFRDVSAEQKQKLEKTNRLFCLALAGLCLSPLRKGVNSKSVLRSIGLWVGCCFLSKTFRQECGKLVSGVMGPLMSEKTKVAKPGSMLDTRKGYFYDESRLPLTPEGVAVVQIAFCKQAYLAMRESNADVEQILRQYQQAAEFLYREAEANGVSRNAVKKSMRKIAGDLMDKDVSFLAVFEETAYDVIMRGPDTRHVQRYCDGENIREREYTMWEGVYVDEDGVPYGDAFSPRVPADVNTLRMYSKLAWDKAMRTASTPEEWGDVISSSYARQIQQRYLYYMKFDNHLEQEQLMDLNALMRPDDDVSWLLDMNGKDPFHVGSLDDSIGEFLQHGPKPDMDGVHLGNYPEFKSAYCKWLNTHPDASPMAFQASANRKYLEYADGGKQDQNLFRQIEAYLLKRDDLKSRWDKVFEDVTTRMHFGASGGHTKGADQRIVRELPEGNWSFGEQEMQV